LKFHSQLAKLSIPEPHQTFLLDAKFKTKISIIHKTGKTKAYLMALRQETILEIGLAFVLNFLRTSLLIKIVPFMAVSMVINSSGETPGW
jgi:hypothetical protein